MHRAFPGSEYYGGSAPPPTDRPTTNPAQPAAPECAAAGRPRAVPVFTVIRSSKEEPDSAPAASPRVRRRPSPQPPGRRLHDSQRVPHHQTNDGGCAPLPALIHQVRAGKALRGVTTSVPRVLLSDLLTGPHTIWRYWRTPALSGLLPPNPASPGPGCPQLLPNRCDGPAAKVSHPHSNQQRLTAHEAGPERIRDHLRRPHHTNRKLADAKTGSTVNRTPPSGRCGKVGSSRPSKVHRHGGDRWKATSARHRTHRVWRPGLVGRQRALG
jgi:hypothetical protein